MGRSRATKPTLKQKKLISDAGLIAKNWMVLREDETGLHLVNRASGRSRCVKKIPRESKKR